MEFQSHIVVTSQGMNKKIGAPTPSCVVYKQVNAQPWDKLLCIKVKQWAMGGKTKSRCHLGMLKVSKLRQSYLNVMKLESYGPTGEFPNNNH